MSNRPIRDDGCCEGIGADPPRRLGNPPGQAALNYRIGRHTEYLAAMQAQLSSAGTPALAALTTREASDLSLAIADALACSLDVLGFYTERYVQEHYLRSATERLSVLEMARLIGYRLKPGVAATTYLAFTLQDNPGAPSEPIIIPAGTRVQSVPGQDEQAQTFETVAAVPARVAWNAIPVQHDEVRSPAYGDTGLWLQGSNTRLEAGNLLLIVGEEQLQSPAGERWDVRVLTGVESLPERNLTRVRWEAGLGHSSPFVLPAGEGVRVYTFRSRTTAFGANAPDWRALSDEAKASYLGLIDGQGSTNTTGLTAADHEEWPEFTALAPVYPERRGGGGLGAAIVPGALEAFENPAAEVATIDPIDTIDEFTIGSSRRQPLVRSPDRIDIARLNESIVAGGWALLAVPGSAELYRISEVTSASRAEYLLSGQTTRLRLSGELPDGRLPAEFEQAVRSLAVHVESDELTLARTPLESPLYGDRIGLDGHVFDLLPGQPLALSGRRQRILIVGGGELSGTGEDGGIVHLGAGDSLVLLEPPERLVREPLILPIPPIGGIGAPTLATPRFSLARITPFNPMKTRHLGMTPAEFADAIGDQDTELSLVLEDRDGTRVQVELRGSDIALGQPEETDPEIAEMVFLGATSESVTADRDRSYLQLAAATRHCYARLGTRLNGNCALATHGETVEALLGSGDGSAVNQAFTLNQAPLTYVSADTPSGAASTLEVRINDVLWQERPTLYRAAADAQVYRTRQDDAGSTTIEFGDGGEGARLPGGESNVRARYRKGHGVAGNVAAGKLTTLLSRPLGVAEVANPESASGGEDGETLDRARSNAPLTVLTLDRVVSITDYANFARAFAGIDEAHALWIPAGPARGVFLTIAGVGGVPVPPASDTYNHLGDALRKYGDPLLPLRIVDYREVRFRCRLSIKVFARFETDPVIAAVESALRAHFAFAQRSFGQTVSVDEVAAVAQEVEGVEAVHVTQLYRVGAAATLEPRLFAALPVASLTALPEAAQLLLISDEPIELEVLP